MLDVRCSLTTGKLRLFIGSSEYYHTGGGENGTVWRWHCKYSTYLNYKCGSKIHTDSINWNGAYIKENCIFLHSKKCPYKINPKVAHLEQGEPVINQFSETKSSFSSKTVVEAFATCGVYKPEISHPTPSSDKPAATKDKSSIADGNELECKNTKDGASMNQPKTSKKGNHELVSEHSSDVLSGKDSGKRPLKKKRRDRKESSSAAVRGVLKPKGCENNSGNTPAKNDSDKDDDKKNGRDGKLDKKKSATSSSDAERTMRGVPSLSKSVLYNHKDNSQGSHHTIKVSVENQST